MTKGTRGRYTLEFKQEAVRLVESGQRMAEAARSLGVVEQTLGNWMKLHRAGRLKGVWQLAERQAQPSQQHHQEPHCYQHQSSYDQRPPHPVLSPHLHNIPRSSRHQRALCHPSHAQDPPRPGKSDRLPP
jgi:transposase